MDGDCGWNRWRRESQLSGKPLSLSSDRNGSGPWSYSRLGDRHLLAPVARLKSRPDPRPAPRVGAVHARKELPPAVKSKGRYT